MDAFLSENSKACFCLGKTGKSYHCPLWQQWKQQCDGYMKRVLLNARTLLTLLPSDVLRSAVTQTEKPSYIFFPVTA